MRNSGALNQKIIIAGMTKTIEAFFDEKSEYFSGKSTSIIISNQLNSKYILALLNSNLISFIFRQMFKHLTLQGGYLNIGPRQLEQLPFVIPSKSQEKELIFKVNELLKLISQKNKTGKDSDKFIALQNQIEKTQLNIDIFVYRLYGLSLEEIKIIKNEN